METINMTEKMYAERFNDISQELIYYMATENEGMERSTLELMFLLLAHYEMGQGNYKQAFDFITDAELMWSDGISTEIVWMLGRNMIEMGMKYGIIES